MTAVPQRPPVPVRDYLAAEAVANVKHEFVAGAVYAMTGGSNAHNLIAGNAFGCLHARLRGRRCRPHNSDTKIRIRQQSQTRFYYPDASVICRSNPASDPYQDEPVVVIEVLSPSTRRIDEGEKKDAYLTIPSLHAYLLVEHDSAAVTVFRRADQGFVRETFVGLDAVISLPEVEAELRLAELYERAELTSEAGD